MTFTIISNASFPEKLSDKKVRVKIEKIAKAYKEAYQKRFGKRIKLESYCEETGFFHFENLSQGVSAKRLKQLTRMLQND